MRDDRSPTGWSTRFLAACVSLFAGALALNLAVDMLAQIWVQLLVAGLAIVAICVGVFVYRWRRDHW